MEVMQEQICNQSYLKQKKAKKRIYVVAKNLKMHHIATALIYFIRRNNE
jgi:hypothetical protein